jgi:thioredoxin 1
MALELTKENFKEVLETKEKTIVVDFWAAWCGPCRMIAPVLDSLSKEREDAIIAKVNVDENKELAVEYGIRNIPTLLYIKNGEVVNKSVGAVRKEEIVEKIESA